MDNRTQAITPEYLSLRDLAAYTSISTRTVSKWIKSGMPHYRIGGSLRIKRSEFDEWVKRFHVSEEDAGNKVEAVFEEVMRDMGMPCRKRWARKAQGH